MDKPFFSIIIPCYNYGQRVGKAISSVLNQKISCSYEILVVDDGSTDNSKEVVNSFVRSYKDVIRYIHQKNSGPAVARNQGIAETLGEYLIFLDADDELADSALQIFSEAAANYPNACLIVGGHYAIHEDGKSHYHNPGELSENRVENFYNYLANKLGMANGAVAVKRVVFDHVCYDPALRQSEDIPVFATIFANFSAVAIDKPTAIIYRHGGSLRSNVVWAEKMGFLLVDKIFCQKLPAACYRYESWYRSRKGLSLFRLYYKSGRKKQAAKYYHGAIAEWPKNLFLWMYLRKYLKMQLGFNIERRN